MTSKVKNIRTTVMSKKKGKEIALVQDRHESFGARHCCYGLT